MSIIRITSGESTDRQHSAAVADHESATDRASRCGLRRGFSVKVYPSTQPGHPNEDELTVLTKFTMRFSVPLLIRKRNVFGMVEIAGGSGFLMLMNGRKRVVTASHIVQNYRDEYVADPATLFTCQMTNFVPDKRIVGEDRLSDVIVLDVEDLDFRRDDAELPPLGYFDPQSWPGNDAYEGDRVFLGGWPGAYRIVSEEGLFVYSGYDAILNVPVTSRNDDEFSMRFDRTEWKSFVNRPGEKPPDYVEDRRLGGHSGDAVFRIGPNGERPELVGIVKQYLLQRDTMVCCPITKIRGDGTVKASSIGFIATSKED